MPEISVLMPVYNAAGFLSEALESILSQTLPDFECIIIDDGSTDGSQEIVRRRGDPRIVFLQNQENLGVARTLNKGMAIARGRFVARMDADDVSLPDRLRRQRHFLERHSQAGLCGSWVWTKEGEGRRHALRFPVDPQTLQAYVLFNNPLAHPAVMWRTDLFQRHGLYYDETCEAGQDYELWSRCLRCFPVYNIPEFLLEWRVHGQGVTHRCFDRSNAAAMMVQRLELIALGLQPTMEEALFHRRTGNGCGVPTLSELRQAAGWLQSLLGRNKTVRRYDQIGMKRAASLVWFRLCSNSVCLGPTVLREYLRVSSLRGYSPSLLEALIFIVGSLLPSRRVPAGEFLGSTLAGKGCGRTR